MSKQVSITQGENIRGKWVGSQKKTGSRTKQDQVAAKQNRDKTKGGNLVGIRVVGKKQGPEVGKKQWSTKEKRVGKTG